MISVGFGVSDVGKIRKANQDCFVVDDDLGLYAVADGLGGCPYGEVAASIATLALVEHIEQERTNLWNARRQGMVRRGASELSELEALLRSGFEYANSRFRHAIHETPKLTGMGCTLSALLIVGAAAVMAHVGDSRAYLIRDGSAKQLTRDHAAVFLPEPWPALTSYIGCDGPMTIDTHLMAMERNDRVLLCTDGLNSLTADLVVLGRAVGRATSQDAAQSLVNTSVRIDGNDNTTAVVVGIDVPEPSLGRQLFIHRTHPTGAPGTAA